jgi:sarcosine oxidase subunit delta
MAVVVRCPQCGARPSTEFVFGGELRPVEAPDAESDFARVYLPENAAGPQAERWYHALGCRRWCAVRRDTTTNEAV